MAMIEPSKTLDDLGRVGIDFSVPRHEILQWLSDPEFTPYPAFAQALLARINGVRLRRPVFIDVIAFNYEHSPGEPSPRRVEDVDFELLEQAVVRGSNNRYDEATVNFSDLLVH